MKSIITITNEIGEEVSKTLSTNDSKLYFQETALLYSLTENLLKFLVATNNCWVESCKKVDEAETMKKEGKTVPSNYCDVDFGVLRKRAKKMRFVDAITEAYKTDLINEELKEQLDKIRIERNDLIHQLSLFENRNDESVMRTKLEEAENIVKALVPIFEHLLYDEIGFDETELPEIFIPV